MISEKAVEAAAFQIRCDLGCTITAARLAAQKALAAALSLHDAPVERLKRALQKIADLVDSEADEPLDDAIAIANKALIAEKDGKQNG